MKPNLPERLIHLTGTYVWNTFREYGKEREVTPDDGLLIGIIEGHEELGVLSNATDKVPHKDVEAVGGGGLDPCWDPAVVCLDVGLCERKLI